MSYKSPGVYSEEYNIRTAKRTPNAVRAAFAGNFQKGPVGVAVPITSLQEFIETFGYPNDITYNDWYQVANFLEYYPGILVTRIENLNHTFDETIKIGVNFTHDSKVPVNSFRFDEDVYKFDVKVMNSLQKLPRYTRFTIEGKNADRGSIYTLIDPKKFKFTPALTDDVFKENLFLKLNGVTNASVEMPSEQQFSQYGTDEDVGTPANKVFVENLEAFMLEKDLIRSNNPKTPLTIWARNPGSWGNNIEVAIAKPEDFSVNLSATSQTSFKQVFDGVTVDGAFRKAPIHDQIGVLVMANGVVVEQYIVRPDKGKGGMFIEDEINSKSAYIYVKRGHGPIYSTVMSEDNIKRPLRLLGGFDSEVSISDVKKAYEVFENKDIYKVDVVIGNELDAGLSAIKCAMKRQDLTAIIGADYNLFNTKDPAKIVDNLVDWREHLFISNTMTESNYDNNINANVLKSSHVVYVGNYLVIFDEYNNKARMINIAGDIAGLRCLTNADYGEWRASAGVNRGVLKTKTKLIFSPTQAHRDIMYAHNINAVIPITGVGNVMWGNRTLADLEDNFLSWHIRSMTNMIITSANSILRQYVMENINHFTMHSVIASLDPLLTQIKAGGGLVEYYIQCDGNNNNYETMSNNELYVDLYFKPTGVAEYIKLRLVNSGSETIANVITKEQFKNGNN